MARRRRVSAVDEAAALVEGAGVSRGFVAPQECISATAVRTKFEQHAQQAKRIAAETKAVMDHVLDESEKQMFVRLAREGGCLAP